MTHVVSSWGIGLEPAPTSTQNLNLPQNKHHLLQKSWLDGWLGFGGCGRLSETHSTRTHMSGNSGVFLMLIRC